MIKKQFCAILLLLLPFFLVIFAPQAAKGAANGLVLWFNQVLPVLFPFSFILQLIIASDALSVVSPLPAPVIGKLFHLSAPCGFCILSGFLCGFPMGAMTASQALEHKMISREEAQLLAGICNHASPMFFTGYTLNQTLPEHPLKPFLLLIFYISPLLWLWIRCLFRHHFHPSLSTKPITAAFENKRQIFPTRILLLNSAELMLKIGVCMMFFSIFQEIIRSLPFISPSSAAVLSLFLEITSGSAAISRLPWTEFQKTIFIMGGTAFGGLCIAFQSYTVLKSKTLSFVQYLADKSAVGIITAALVWILYQIMGR